MMRHNTESVTRWILAAVMVATIGCAPRPGERVESRTFPLHIALSGPLGGGLPKDLLELTLPFQGEECAGVALTPLVHLVRLDLDSAKAVELKPELDWIARLQQKVHAGSLKQRRGSAERGFKRAALPVELSLPAAPMTSPAGAKLEAIVGPPLAEKAVWVMDDAEDGSATGMTPAGYVFHDAATFQKEVSKDLCGAAVRGEELRSIYVLYLPPAWEQPQVAAPLSPAHEEPTGNPPSLTQVREDLEHGKLDVAERELTKLRVARPELEDAAQLERELHTKLRARIVLRKPDGQAQQVVFTDPGSIVVPFGSHEQEFSVQVEPGEAVYFYLYGEYSDDRVVPLFSHDEPAGVTALASGHSYLLPTDETAYALTSDSGARLTGLFAVATRWRSRDLEALSKRLVAEDHEATILVRKALSARQQAMLGGCDVRAVRFQMTEQTQTAKKEA